MRRSGDDAKKSLLGDFNMKDVPIEAQMAVFGRGSGSEHGSQLSYRVDD
jgi:hypothetical protein